MTAPSCKITVADVLPQFMAYMSKPGNGAAGVFHIVIDDDNVRDEFVDACLETARAAGDTEAIALGEKLRQLSQSQRIKLSGMRAMSAREIEAWKLKQPKKVANA